MVVEPGVVATAVLQLRHEDYCGTCGTGQTHKITQALHHLRIKYGYRLFAVLHRYRCNRRIIILLWFNIRVTVR